MESLRAGWGHSVLFLGSTLCSLNAFDSLPYLHAMVTLAGRLTFSLVNTPGRVNPPTQLTL